MTFIFADTSYIGGSPPHKSSPFTLFCSIVLACRYSPDSVRWELIEYESVDYDLLLQDLADGVYEAGTVFVYKSNVTSADVIQQRSDR